MFEGDRAIVNAIAVMCEDGQVRHETPFVSRAAAAKFANWGHCCTNSHTFDLVRIEVVLTSDMRDGGFFDFVDASGEQHTGDKAMCPAAFGIREGEGWWSVVQYEFGEPQGGDAHWLQRAFAERAQRLYLDGCRFPIKTWHPCMGEIAEPEPVPCG